MIHQPEKMWESRRRKGRPKQGKIIKNEHGPFTRGLLPRLSNIIFREHDGRPSSNHRRMPKRGEGWAPPIGTVFESASCSMMDDKSMAKSAWPKD